MKHILAILGLILTLSIQAFAEVSTSAPIQAGEFEGPISEDEEINPFDPNIENVLNEFDQMYFEETGELPFLPNFSLFTFASKCYRQECPVYAYVSLSQQRMYLYLNGQQIGDYLVSTGAKGFSTPALDKRPNGRIYERYSSTKFPGGDYKGLGNMPYAVFISGGIAIHGTTKGNFKHLGKRASHGCVRVHPNNALVFNRLVRQYGVANSWVTIQ
jgi:hypothetical protein